MSEPFLRAFHAARPGVTSRAFARTNSYAALAAVVADRRRVLDLACGDGPLLSLLPRGSIGVDLSLDEAVLASGGVAQARAQALPFRAAAFDACVSHLAFMLFDELPSVVGELARVIEPGGSFAAIVGGGPAADDDETDAFQRFLAIASPYFVQRGLGDRRASREDGWRELFAHGWDDIAFERRELQLGGTFDEVWTFLGASYALDPAHASRVRDQLRDDIGERATCRVVTWLARVIRR